MLADDPIARSREMAGGSAETAIAPAYERAFDAIAADPNNALIVATAGDTPEAPVIGVLQLTFIPSLTYSGGTRAQIEGVRVHGDWRDHGVGSALIRHAIERARDAGCTLVQLTTDRRRADAHRFYERLGFVTSHWGMKRLIGRVEDLG